MVKRYAMEFVGTFFLTIAISLIANPLAIGLVLMAMIYVGGHISGAHFNPAVSFAWFIQNRLKLADMLLYVASQSLGALLGLCFFTMITNDSFTVDVMPGSPIIGPTVLEALLVLLFTWVYLTMNIMNRYKDTAIPGMVLGLTLLAISWGVSGVGGLFNPALAIASIASSIVKGGGFSTMESIVIYIAGPLLGAFGASLMFDYFKSE